MLMSRPKFMENKDWYYNDETQEEYIKYGNACFRLTELAPKDAVESYLSHCENFYKYSLGYVPEFVYEDYRKYITKFK